MYRYYLSFLTAFFGLLCLGLLLSHDAWISLSLLQHLFELLEYFRLYSFYLLTLDLLVNHLQLLHFPAHQQCTDLVVQVGDSNIFSDHVCHIGKVRVMCVYFSILIDGFL